MVCSITGVATGRTMPPQSAPKTPPKKCPLQVSSDLHSLISKMAADRNQSLEQVVSTSVIKQAKAALPTITDPERQYSYSQSIHRAEEEIKLRYHGEKTRRSIQMRRINDERRKKSGAPATPHSSASKPQRPYTNNPYGYPVEYRYGFAVPKPPPSSYPTYFH